MSQMVLTRKRWHAMRARCDNPNTDNYEKYGGLDIGYHPDWAKYENFLEDMGVCPFGYVLDRVDNNKGYSPGNCRWATKADSAKNRTTTVVTYEQAKTIKMLARARNPNVSVLSFSAVVARTLGLTTSLVRDIVRGKSWQSIEV